MKLTETKLQEMNAEIDAAAAELEPTIAPSQWERGMIVRMMLVVVLALTLVGALRWAMNVTNANAKQISDNLRKVQDKLDANAAQGMQEQNKSGATTSGVNLKENGPVIGPATNSP